MSAEDEPFYDITEGDWRVVALPHGDHQARIEFTFRGQPYRSINGYPAYKVWNIPAHMRDIVADFESGMDMASWSGFPMTVLPLGVTRNAD